MEKNVIKPTLRYSHAFKLQVVREVESGAMGMKRAGRKYGVYGATTIRRWVRQFGNGSVGKIIRVEKPREINELARLRAELRRTKEALADAHIDLALERAYTELACERAGIEVEAFKKKAAGQLRTKH